jgi:uncharacterized protein with FMN-binding domain
MSKRPIVAVVLTVAALALLLSFKTPQVAGLTATGGTGTGGGTVTGNGTSGGAVVVNAGSGQYTGSAVQIPFGTVQVQVTVANGKITDVQPLQMPGGGHSGQVSSYAAPQLRSEVLQAQSANVDSISGATYTSGAYQQSLQSALSQAGM